MACRFLAAALCLLLLAACAAQPKVQYPPLPAGAKVLQTETKPMAVITHSGSRIYDDYLDGSGLGYPVAMLYVDYSGPGGRQAQFDYFDKLLLPQGYEILLPRYVKKDPSKPGGYNVTPPDDMRAYLNRTTKSYIVLIDYSGAWDVQIGGHTFSPDDSTKYALFVWELGNPKCPWE
jgi:hypothetical protein